MHEYNITEQSYIIWKKPIAGRATLTVRKIKLLNGFSKILLLVSVLFFSYFHFTLMFFIFILYLHRSG